MRNTHSPGKKFSFFRVAATTHRVNNADKNVLEDIFGKILVFNQEQDWGVELVLMTDDQNLQGFEIPFRKKVDQLIVCFLAKSFHVELLQV